MALPDYDTMVTSKTEAQYITQIETYAADGTNFSDGVGLPVSSWQEHSVPKVLIAAVAVVLASLDSVRVLIAKGGLLYEAVGDWLTLLAYNVYQLLRTDAVATEGEMVLTDSGNNGPFSITPDQHWIANGTGLKFRVKNGGILSSGGTFTAQVVAEATGGAYNIGTDDATLSMVTALAGVTVTNPAVSGGTTWITTSGAAQETDSALQSRCSLRWPSQGLGMTDEAWEYWALQSDTQVKRVKVKTNPGGVAGKVGVLIAAANGEIPSGDLAAIDTFLQAKVTTTTTLETTRATEETVAISGTVNVASAYHSQVSTTVAAELAKYEATVGIEGTVYLSKIIANIGCAFTDLAAIQNIVLTAPAVESTAVSTDKIAKFDLTGLTFVAV